MGESLKVRNVGRGQVSFMVYPPVECPEGLPKHKRRKMSRDAVRSVVIPRAQICDLVEVTGLSEEVLRSLPEIQAILKNPNVQEVTGEIEPEAPADPESQGDEEPNDDSEAEGDGEGEPKDEEPKDDSEAEGDGDGEAEVDGEGGEESPTETEDPTETEAPEHTEDSLNEMTKATLVGVGSEMGLELEQSDLKADLVAAILEAQGSNDE